MPIKSGTLDANDLINLNQAQVLAGDIQMDDSVNILDPNSPSYNPEMVPRDPETGEAFTDAAGDPTSPDYNPDDPRAKMSIWEVAKDDWVTTKVHNWAIRQSFDDDPYFVPPWGDLPESYDPYITAFEGAKSEQEWNHVRDTVDKSLAIAEQMSTVGLKDGAAYFGIQMLDPVLMPLYLVNLPLSVAGKTLTSGKAVAQTAARVGAYTAAETAAIEGVLQGVDPTRTLDESVTTVLASAVMGSVLGAAGQAVVQRFGKNVVTAQNEAREVVDNALIASRSVDGDSAGAMSILPTLDGQKPLFNPTKGITLRSPSWRLLYDDVSPSASDGVDLLVPHNLLKKQNVEGKAPIDTPLYSAIMQERERATANMVLSVRKGKKALAKQGQKFSEAEIGTMIGRAARRGDEIEYPELRPAVQAFRNMVDDWGQRAKRVGIITDDALESVESYFPRLYDSGRISRNYGRWREVIGTHFSQKYPELIESELDDIAASIHNTISGTAINQMHLGSFKAPAKVLSSGHLKARTLDISDIDLEEFLVDDARYVAQHYMRSIAPAVLAREQFGADDIDMESGYPVIKSIINRIDQDYKNAMNKLPSGADATKLKAKRDRAMDDMKYLMSSVLGYGNPAQGMTQGAQWGRVISAEARAFTSAATLGAMTVAAISDLANLVLDHGLANLIRSMPAIAMPRKFSNSAKADFDAMAIGMDTVLSTRMLRMADLEDQAWNAFDRGIGGQTVATGAFKMFGANLWNSWMKRAAATASQNRILNDVTKYSQLSKARRTKLASLGIDESTARMFADNFQAQATKKRQGVNWADTSNWSDEAASKFERILFRDVETTIVTPQAGDMPKILDNGAGLMVAQFKRFVMSHQQQIMTQAAQRLAAKDVAALNYVVALAGFALTSEYLRLLIKNKYDVDETNKAFSKYTPSDLAFKAIDRGAGLSFGTDVLMGIDGLTDGEFGQMLGFSDTTTYAGHQMALDRKIPAVGYMSKGVKTVSAVAAEASGGKPFNKKDLHALRQMIPLQNVFYLSWLFDQMEDIAGDAMNLPSGGRTSSSGGYTQ